MTASLPSWLGGKTAGTLPHLPHLPETAPAAPPPPHSSPPPPPEQNDGQARPIPAVPADGRRRLARQFALPLFGAVFVLLSIRLTRRAVARQRAATLPPFYHPNMQPPAQAPSGARDAVEALQLASLNVFSVAVFLVGGGAFALDVSTLDELRAKFRANQRGHEWEEKNRAAEEEWEEWAVGVLARKELKDRVKARVAEESSRRKDVR